MNLEFTNGAPSCDSESLRPRPFATRRWEGTKLYEKQSYIFCDPGWSDWADEEVDMDGGCVEPSFAADRFHLLAGVAFFLKIGSGAIPVWGVLESAELADSVSDAPPVSNMGAPGVDFGLLLLDVRLLCVPLGVPYPGGLLLFARGVFPFELGLESGTSNLAPMRVVSLTLVDLLRKSPAFT